MLLFPPQWIPHQPHLGLPSLVGFLNNYGLDVSQKDLNIESYDHFLSRRYLRSLKPRLEEKFAILDHQLSLSPGFETQMYSDLFLAKSSIHHLANSVEEAKTVFRSSDYYNSCLLSNARNTLNNALTSISIAYFPTRLEIMSLSMPSYDGTFSSIDTLTTDRSQNPYIEFYETSVLRQINEHTPGIIGISIIGETQLVPALTLSRLIKKRFPNVHVVLGGYIVTLLSSVFKSNPQMFGSFFDSLIVLEGELPMLKLTRSIENREPLDGVPNLIYRSDDKICENAVIAPEPMSSLPPPDFDGLPLDRYLSPEPVLPVLAARGCYWGKCAFCSHNISYENKYRVAPADKTIADLKHLATRYGVRHFAFSDEAIAPSLMRRLVSLIIENKIDFRFSTNIRLESQFDPALCKEMYHAGFRVVYLGLESGCDRVLGLMNKGFTQNEALVVCRNLVEAGIWNHLYIFVGFPGEQATEAEETMKFLIGAQDAVKSFNIGAFTLARGSKVIQNPEKYGVTLPSGDASANFSIGFDYQVIEGLSRAEAIGLSDAAWTRFINDYPTRDILTTISKEDLLLYLSHYESTDPWLSGVRKEQGQQPQYQSGNTVNLTGDSKPRLCPAVTRSALNFYLPSFLPYSQRRTIPIPRRKTWIIFDASSHRMRQVDVQTWAILELCDGIRTIDIIAQRFAQINATQTLSVNDYCLKTLNSLVAEGYLVA